MRQFAKGALGSLLLQVRDEDGAVTAPDAAPSLSVTDDSGTEVATGTAGEVTEGWWSLALPDAVRTALGRYTATWSFDVGGVAVTKVQPIEVIGEYLFEVAEFRESFIEFQDEARYPTRMIAAAREAATDRFENSAMVKFSARRRRRVLSGDGTTTLLLPDVEVTEILEATLDSVALTVADLDLDVTVGKVTNDTYWTLGSRNIEIRYQHGLSEIEGPVREAVQTLAAEYLVRSPMPARASSQATDLGEFRIIVANPEAGRDTGIPEVDSVATLFGRRRPLAR